MSEEQFRDDPGLPIEESPTTRQSRFHSFKGKLSQGLNRETFLRAIQNFDPQAMIEWVSKRLQKRGTGLYGTLATITLSTYFLSDLTALILAEYIPEPATNRIGRMGGNFGQVKSINSYSTIFSRNLFNSQGLIPGEEGTPGNSDPGGAPVRTTLPLNLIGTLIMSNELRSIATIEDKGSSIVYPVRVDDEIPDKLRVLKVEARKVIFVNKASNRREFIDLPEDNVDQIFNPKITAGRAAGGIEKVASTQFNVPRTEVDRALADFNNILTQARAVPNFENGAPAGYKLFQIVPGSIYDKLGLQNGDVIAGLNGQAINDPAKAFELLADLKTSNHLELQVKKDGRPLTYTYDIH